MACFHETVAEDRSGRIHAAATGHSREWQDRVLETFSYFDDACLRAHAHASALYCNECVAVQKVELSKPSRCEFLGWAGIAARAATIRSFPVVWPIWRVDDLHQALDGGSGSGGRGGLCSAGQSV